MKKHLPTAELVSALLLALCVLLVAMVHARPGFPRYAEAVSPFFILTPDTETEEKIEGFAGLRRDYTFTIPEAKTATTSGLRLMVYLRHTVAAFRIEGTELCVDYSADGSPRTGTTPGNYWISIPMRPMYAGKTLHLSLTPLYPGVKDAQPQFMIISREALLRMVELPRDALLLVSSVLALTLGLLLALLVLFLPLERRDKRRVFYLGAVTALAGVWKLCGLPVVPLLFIDLGIHKELWFAGSLSYLLMLVLSLRLLSAMRESRVSAVCFYLSAAAAALVVLLQIFDLAELHELLVWYGLGMAVLHLVSLLGRRPTRRELLWLLPFFLALGIDLLIWRATGSMHNAPAFLLWIMLNLFVYGFGFLRKALLRERLLRKQEQELRDARIRTMMNQIRPHFIYNTLVSIYVLCREDPERAAQVVSDFTGYLQANFTAMAATEPISFGDELHHTRAYLAVENVLYGDRLITEFDTDYAAFRLPPLTLQPIVENAVKFGVGQGHAPEHILIRSRAVSGGAEISVEDDGPGFAPPSDGKAHIGLENVRERLRIMCGGELSVGPGESGGTLVRVFIPAGEN